MTTRYAVNTRQVVIERGAKGFGFTLRHPQAPHSGDIDLGQREPVYTIGAQVRSVEDQGPARRGGLEKDEFVTTVNKEFVGGKSYLQVINMIQATNRLLSLEVASPALAGEDVMTRGQPIETDNRDQAMEESVAEKENQAVLQLNLASSGEALLNTTSGSAWRHSGTTIVNEFDLGVPITPTSSVAGVSSSVVLPPRTSAIYTDEQRFRIIREFEQCARDHSADEEEDEDSSSYRRASRLHAQTNQLRSKSPVFGTSMSKASYGLSQTNSGGNVGPTTGLSASPALYGARVFGLTRSTGHLCDPAGTMDDSGGGGSGDGEGGGIGRPMVTIKKAYGSPSPGGGADSASVPHYSGFGTSVVGSGIGSNSGAVAGGCGTPRRTSLGVTGSRDEMIRHGGRAVHHLTTTEPRINFKKRKSGNSSGGMGANYSSTPSVAAAASGSFRAHSVTNLPATEASSVSHRLGHPSGGGAHSVLSSMPSSSRHQRVGSPPSAMVTSTLMHSPLRRGSSPARSAVPSTSSGGSGGGLAAPLSGVEEFDNSIPTSPTISPPSSSGFHETRFSMMPDRVVSVTYQTHGNSGRARSRPLGVDEVEGALQLSGRPAGSSVTSTTSFTPVANRLRSATTSSTPSSTSSFTSHNSAMSPPHSTSHLQQHMETSACVTSSSSSLSTTISIRPTYRTASQLARQQFMMSHPTPAPALPLPFSSSNATTTTTSVVSPQRVGASGQNPENVTTDTSVLRRESYINAVKTTRITMSPDAIEEGEEQDDGADSVIDDNGENQVDGQNSNLTKAKRFFGESWTRRSARNKTPKVREALTGASSNASGLSTAAEKKFYLSVKVVREDGKEARSKSWKSFSLTIENDVMYLIRERKESSASSSSSADDMPPIPLRQCHFEWTAPDQSRKKYLVCRMYVNPASPPTESTSTTALSTGGGATLGSVTASSSATPIPSPGPQQQQQPAPLTATSSVSLHSSSPPTVDPSPMSMSGGGMGSGVSEYKLQFSNAEEMQAFCRCLPESAASVSVIGGPPDLTATYPPPSKISKKPSKGPGLVKSKKDTYESDLVSASTLMPSYMDPDFSFGALPYHTGQQPATSKTRLLAFVRNIRWKSSSTESTTTTSGSSTASKFVRTDELSAARMKSVSPDELGRPLPGATFGVPLMQVPRSSYSPYVPLVVELCARIVEACGLHCVGVYRVSPKKAVIDALEAELNECGSQLNLIDRTNERWNDVHAVSGLLKCFLRKMPDPVFPFGLYNQFLEASDRRLPHERKMLLLQRLLAMMDEESPEHPEYKHHRETLKYLAQHLHRVASHSHINKMTTKNLVSMIAPNVFRPPGDSNVTLLMQATAQGATILELVIHYHEWFFSTEMDAACEVPAPLPTDTGPAMTESCGGDHDGEAGGHSTDEALGGAEDRGPQNRGPDIPFRAGEKATDILASVLDAAMACQEEVSPESQTDGHPDEGGFDEVDIDAAVRRRQQMDEAAAATSAMTSQLGVTISMTSSTSTMASTSSSTAVTSSISSSCTSTLIADATPSVTATPATPVGSSSNSSSVSKPVAEETAAAGDFPGGRRGSGSSFFPPAGVGGRSGGADAEREWRQVHQRAEVVLSAAASPNSTSTPDPLRRDGGRWFGAAVQEQEEVPGPPLPPRRYDAAAERLRLASPEPSGPSESLATAPTGGLHMRQISKSLDSLAAASDSAAAAAATTGPTGSNQQAGGAPVVPRRTSQAERKRHRAAVTARLSACDSGSAVSPERGSGGLYETSIT